MRLIVRKALKFVHLGDQQCFRKYLIWIYKISKIGPMESLNAGFFQLLAKIIKSFVLVS